MMKKLLNTIACLFLLAGALCARDYKVTVEAPSPDPTLIVRGPEKEINFINTSSWQEKDNALFLFTAEFGKAVNSSKTQYVAIQVDKQMRVTAIINGGVNKSVRPAFNQGLDLAIPQGGFVLVASDNAYNSKEIKKYLAESFRLGDLVKLRHNDEIVEVEQLVKLQDAEALPALSLEGDIFRTSLKAKETIKGFVSNYPKGQKCVVSAMVNGKETRLKCDSKGNFSGAIALNPKTNYITLSLCVNDELLYETPLTIYAKEKAAQASEIVLWVEQFPNALKLTSADKVEEMVINGKNAGFTAIGFDVKGPEGYASYRKNNLSKTPYFTNTVNPNKKIEDNGFDLLDAILTAAHKHGMRVFTSFNFFTEGNITASDYAVLNQHKDWEEIVQRPEDKGLLLRVRDSRHGLDAAAGKKIALAFVNPSNKAVQDFQLLRVEEVLQNYPIDGIVLDRCRYDNLYADFSPVTRNAFAEYLQSEGKKLENFPNDAFVIDETGAMQKGRYFNDWIIFRSLTIKKFTDRVRSLVDKYKNEKNPNLKMAAYVGSWYEVYYQNGVNWASSDFRYNDRLGFPESSIYTPDYAQTSYLSNVDFLMIGTYFKTAKEVNRYITLGNILTNGTLPIIGSMSLPDLRPEEQTDVFKASLETSAGLMIFDHCYIKWQEFTENMKNAIRNKKQD